MAGLVATDIITERSYNIDELKKLGYYSGDDYAGYNTFSRIKDGRCIVLYCEQTADKKFSVRMVVSPE